MPQSFSSCNGVDVGATAACPWQFTKITHLYLVWRQNFFEPSGQISLFSSTWSLQLANPVNWNMYLTSQQAFLHIYSKIQREELLCGKKKELAKTWSRIQRNTSRRWAKLRQYMPRSATAMRENNWSTSQWVWPTGRKLSSTRSKTPKSTSMLQ